MMGNHWVSRLHLVFFSILLIVSTQACLGAQNSTVICQERERLALLEFKHSVTDEFKVLSTWVGIDCCSWKGVRCDGATGSVVSLHLRGYTRRFMERFVDYVEEDYYLVGGEVNAYLAELRHLQHLDLSGNNFKGSRIPEFIGSFKKLSYLNLSCAGFSGIIPHHIGNLSNLKVLDLGWCDSINKNWLTPNDMSWVPDLSSLEHLDLSSVNFRQAKNVDMVLNMIFSLRYLSLSGCGLFNADLNLHLNSSKIVFNIEHLDLSYNFFEGQFPLFFQNMTSLKFLDLSYYNLSLPWNSVNLLNMIPSLSELHLSRCGLHSAPFSPTFSNLSVHSNIQHLGLSGNSIGSRSPSELMNMSSLRVLDLSENSLNSSIPAMSNLLKLDISDNNFEHIELVGMWRQCELKELSISGNHFRETIGPSTNTSECSKYALEILDLSNSFTESSSIPEALGRLTNLRALRLMSNSFTGTIPKALERLRSLEVLNLANNDLTGHIPTFLGRLTTLCLSINQFSGSIPESLGRLTGLTSLSLESNLLTGPLPASIGRLASLQVLSVSSNMLNGSLPVSLGQLTKLVVLDVSNNSLEGVVMEAHFANLSMLKYLYAISNHNLTFNISNEWIPPFQLMSFVHGSSKIANGIPQWLGTQRKLNELVLVNASLYGTLPRWMRDMPMLSYLNLSHNKLSGSLKNLPPGYSHGFYMSFYLKDNLFNGSIARSLCRRTGLIILDVSKNRLSGNIPNCVEYLQNMRMLILSSNGLSGVLPNSLGNISSSLEWLKLNDNNFIGKLPRELGKLRSLKVLDLGNNKFSGNIPKWIGKKLFALGVLRLYKNNFTGRIPQTLCKCSKIQILDVADIGFGVNQKYL